MVLNKMLTKYRLKKVEERVEILTDEIQDLRTLLLRTLELLDKMSDMLIELENDQKGK